MYQTKRRRRRNGSRANSLLIWKQFPRHIRTWYQLKNSSPSLIHTHTQRAFPSFFFPSCWIFPSSIYSSPSYIVALCKSVYVGYHIGLRVWRRDATNYVVPVVTSTDSVRNSSRDLICFLFCFFKLGMKRLVANERNNISISFWFDYSIQSNAIVNNQVWSYTADIWLIISLFTRWKSLNWLIKQVTI